MKKYLKLFRKDSLFIVHFAVLMTICTVWISLHGYESKKFAPLKILRKEKELVSKIDTMKNKVRAQMAKNGPAVSSVNPTTLKIEGVLYQHEKPLALIDNDIYQEGDTVGNYKLIKISLTSLVFLNLRTNEEENVVFREPPTEMQTNIAKAK